MYYLRRITIFLAVVGSISFLAWFLPRYLNPNPPDPAKQREDKRWISSSPYWLDRQACRWLSLCGIHHLSWDPAALLPFKNDTDGDELRLELRSLYNDEGRHNGWESVSRKKAPQDKTEAKTLKEIPDYVLKYAPLVHLYSGENFWPADIAEHIKHMTPYLERQALNQSLLLSDLHQLNKEDGMVYLTSDDDVEQRPEWLHSHVGIPEPWNDEEDGGEDDGHEDLPTEDPDRSDRVPSSPLEDTTWFDVSRDHPVYRISDPRRFPHFVPSARTGSFQNRRRDQKPLPPPDTPTHKPDQEGYSKAPAVLVLVDKGSGIVDAFWFFFYSYNLGQTVLTIRFGNHVGDWEHCMMRFENGVPRGIFFSEHEGGQAYTYHAVEKRGDRPVIYSAVGSHAMYAQAGDHPYVLPFKMLKDVTDKGPLWDPAKNAYTYWYDYVQDLDEDLDDDLDDEVDVASGHRKENPVSLVPTAENPDAPTSWFHYAGPWGDKLYSLADMRQWRLFAQYHYVSGPLGPKFKRLDREKLCITTRCRILDNLKPGQTWYS
ncbi:putative vacuolar protein sorting-associated protein TDA6 [Colletotrichum gloeosporioides]|uniref:Vacuolar protein sorting-associated protein n=2 Tax=Colletotrichum gloeosporioides TaxID=474922 RepID=T0JYT2_COLGC|nr:putative vacuolar protein sorting-associated protein TDA6 [Colletotrichum gloeosporioides]EQB45583.1 vacuolar protein sorting-associated protein [Colletotrichum gloeosporioides Cg-14]KAF3809342.1 putative vacuolar protein sorting-associated protein TDA6 [Colletotrichum gloeosporioides]